MTDAPLLVAECGAEALIAPPPPLLPPPPAPPPRAPPPLAPPPLATPPLAPPTGDLRRLFLVSFFLLLLEMAVIRWTTSQFRILAYFGNVVLLACFFGLSVGMLAPRRWSRLFAWFPWILLALQVAVLAFREAGFFFRVGPDAWLWQEEGAAGMRYLRLPTLVIPMYAVIALVFVPIGQQLARAFEGLEPLRAYTVNVLGSLAGVAAQVVFSLLSLPATVWFAVCGLCWMRLARLDRLLGAAGIAGVAIGTVLLAWADARFLWSPYYKIEREPIVVTFKDGSQADLGFLLRVNEDFHQAAWDLRPGTVRQVGGKLVWLSRLYDAPYRLHGATGRVLVLGAGNGNDVAAALRAGARSVDAVELDPAILRLGREHPERPYDDPRVTIVNDDARAFLQRARGPYDLVVFGYLDSHSLLSTMSSVRLDNFVYTLDTLRRVRELIGDGGGVALTFFAGRPWLEHRLQAMMEEAFGRAPVLERHGSSDVVFYLGKDSVGTPLPEAQRPASLPTDDWPFLYLREREVPSDYLWILSIAGLLSALVVRGVAGPWDAGGWHFAALGAGFMLVETRSITALALLFGSTWLVNAFVIGGILTAIVVANAIVARVRVPLAISYGLLFAGLAAALVPPSTFLALGGAGGRFLGTAVYCLPVIGAGLVFADGFRAASRPGAALGANLIGAVAGGLAENLSMTLGLQRLVFLAIGCYLLSAIARRRIVAK